MTFKQFCNHYRIRCDSTMVDENKNATDWKEADHYKVVLRCNGRQMTTYFSMGYGLAREPRAEDLLCCLASDSAGVEQRDFEDWAGDLGYDPDSRKAERTYKVCIAQSDRLRKLLGDERFVELLRCEE